MFKDPLCYKQALLKRIANVAFHIFTLGIPLGGYRLYKCIRTASIKRSHPAEETTPIAEESIAPKLTPMESPSPLGLAVPFKINGMLFTTKFCDRIRMYIDLDKIFNDRFCEYQDLRFIRWHQKDISPETFERKPDSIPT